MVINNSEQLKKAAEAVAEEMLKDGLDEKEFFIPNTKVKLFLVVEGTNAAEEFNSVPGSFFGSSFTVGGKNFLVFRTKKTVVA